MGTTVTIELTDIELDDLRRMPPYSGPGWQVPIINRIYAALPPEPVTLTIELPAGLARHELFDHVTYGGSGAKVLTLAEAAALTAVVKALKAKAFTDAMSDGIEQAMAQGVPLT